MKALQLTGIETIGVKEIPTPQPEKGQTLMRVKSSAICRTDAKMWKMGHRDLVLPRILGHEFCATREGTTTRYVIWPGNACRQCVQCHSGFENLCSDMEILGFHKDGGLAEYVLVSESNLVPVPDNVPDDLACLAEPLACTINALNMAALQKGHKVLIYGAGPVGLMMALNAKVQGADPTICEINPEKINISRNFQNRTGIDVMETLPDDRWHIVINAAPALEIFKEGIAKLEPGGCFCIFSGFTALTGITLKDMIKTLHDVHYRQLRIAGAYGCTRAQMRLALEIVRHHREDLAMLIEKTIFIENVPDVLPNIWAGDALRYIVKFW